MTVRLGDPAGFEPVEPAPFDEPDGDEDDETWWDRHGWEVPTPYSTVPSGDTDVDPADVGAQRSDEWFGWSTLLLSVAVVGGLVTLPVLGLAGAPGRVLAPALWALIGTAVGVRFSYREPRWAPGDARRLGSLLAWGLAYALTALVGLRFFEGVVGWWAPATVLTAVTPFAHIRFRYRSLGTPVRRRLPRRGRRGVTDLPV